MLLTMRFLYSFSSFEIFYFEANTEYCSISFFSMEHNMGSDVPEHEVGFSLIIIYLMTKYLAHIFLISVEISLL